MLEELAMYLKDIGEIIAVRELYIVEQGESDRKVEVRIGKPRLFEDSESYYCPFQIVGVGEEEIKYSAGIDAIQSLQLVMVMIGATLEYFNGELDGRLHWPGATEGKFGFPTGV